MNTNFIPFPEKLKHKLALLEIQKISLIEGFTYSLDISGNFEIAQDLSGLNRTEAPPAPKITVKTSGPS